MNKQFLLALLLFFGGAACKKPQPHLEPSKMAPVLAELHIADAYSNLVKDLVYPNGDKNLDSLAKWTAQIFKRHAISMKEFNQSMDWYRDHPDDLDSLYASVIPILERSKKK